MRKFLICIFNIGCVLHYFAFDAHFERFPYVHHFPLDIREIMPITKENGQFNVLAAFSLRIGLE